MNSIISNLNLIKQQKAEQLSVLEEEYGQTARETPFTGFSTLFAQTAKSKNEYADVISSAISRLDEKYSCGFFSKIDADNVQSVYLQYDGSVTEPVLSSAFTTDFIRVIPNETIKIDSEWGSYGYSHAFYDKDYNVVEVYPAVKPGSTNPGGIFTQQLTSVPAGAAYIRATTLYKTRRPAVYRVDNSIITESFNQITADVISAVEFTQKLAYSCEKKTQDVMTTNEAVDHTADFPAKDGWLQEDKRFYEGSNGSKTSEPIDLLDVDGMYFTGNAQYAVACIMLEDKDYNPIYISQKAVSFNKYKIDAAKIVAEYPAARYIVFSSYLKPYILERRVAMTGNQMYDAIVGSVSYSHGEYKPVEDIVLCSDGYLNKSGGKTDTTGWNYTDYIDFSAKPKLAVSTYARWATAGLAIYDRSKTFLSAALYDGTNECRVEDYKLDFNQLTAMPRLSAAKYIRLAGDASHPASVKEFKNFTADTAFESLSGRIDATLGSMLNSNYLYGKKYVALGDSFTATGVGNTTPYPNLIAARNGMVLKNYAVSGSRMSNPSLSANASKFFPQKYPSVSADLADADYITMCFGLNETGDQSISGTYEDESLSTIFGAWNTTLEKIFTSNPDVKLGIIVADAYTPAWQSDLLKQIGAYWGIPVLDTKCDVNVPMLMGGRTGVNPKMKAIRDAVFTIPSGESGEGHPTQAGHDFRSTIIENFMRSM